MTNRKTSSTQIAQSLNARLENGNDFPIEGPASLGSLKANTVTFLSRPTPERIANIGIRDDVCVLVPLNSGFEFAFPHIGVANPRLAFARIVSIHFVAPVQHSISGSALIDPSATIGKNVNIGHHSIVGANVRIGNDTFIGNYVEIMSDVSIGEQCHIKSQAVIGQEGFGFELDEQNNYFRLPHIGGVVIADNVEVGACSTIAAGTIEPTLIGAYTKIDDHSHVGHNSRLGQNNIVAAGTIVSGSVSTGNHVWFGPNSSMMQGLQFENGCTIGVGAVMYANGKPDTAYSTRPAIPMPKKG